VTLRTASCLALLDLIRAFWYRCTDFRSTYLLCRKIFSCSFLTRFSASFHWILFHCKFISILNSYPSLQKKRRAKEAMGAYYCLSIFSWRGIRVHIWEITPALFGKICHFRLNISFLSHPTPCSSDVSHLLLTRWSYRGFPVPFFHIRPWGSPICTDHTLNRD
jgi:hypothetical protein